MFPTQRGDSNVKIKESWKHPEPVIYVKNIYRWLRKYITVFQIIRKNQEFPQDRTKIL